jgi:hypothetical protein
MIRNQKVFHITLLDLYSPPSTGHPPSEPLLTAVDDFGEWEDERILDSGTTLAEDPLSHKMGGQQLRTDSLANCRGSLECAGIGCLVPPRVSDDASTIIGMDEWD